jgi:hypothetical protein
MLTTVEKWADQLLSVVAPKADAGACPCGDSWCSQDVCDNKTIWVWWRYYTNCNCQVVQKKCNCIY